ncbi:MAG: hypothetical protein HYS13_05185 [Planctomycetia bacterium]|nr:hypothetical protein [Planctomycetia bacterium]
MKSTLLTMGLGAVVLALLLVGAYAQEKPPAADALILAAQKICPVTGEALHAETAFKAKVGEQTMFLCCKDCAGKNISKETWAKVQANQIAAQQRCPVMKRELPKDAPSVVVNGRALYVCCKPCIAKIKADPDKYVKVLDELLANNLKQRGGDK